MNRIIITLAIALSVAFAGTAEAKGKHSSPRGLRGVRGAVGPVGPRGPQGVTGAVGPQGPAGPSSLTALSGFDGPEAAFTIEEGHTLYFAVSFAECGAGKRVVSGGYTIIASGPEQGIITEQATTSRGAWLALAYSTTAQPGGYVQAHAYCAGAGGAVAAARVRPAAALDAVRALEAKFAARHG